MIQEKIKKVVEQIEGLNYMYNDWVNTGMEPDFSGCQFPLCLNVLPASGELRLHNGNFRDCPHCLIAFVDKKDTEIGENTAPVVERMKALAKRFIVEVNKSGLFTPLSQYTPYSIIYDDRDPGLSGVAIEVQLKELIGDTFVNYEL